jgi:hypothetical protein
MFVTLSASVFALFIFNLMPGIIHELIIYRSRGDDGDYTDYIKRDFYVDTTLPMPDIYWIHLDGMMSLETVERFWGESQEDFRTALAHRGFLIYENAELNAGFTRAALTALLSPAFYDSFWRDRLAEAETELRTVRAEYLVNELAKIGLTYNESIKPHYELIIALKNRGYSFVNIRSLTGRLPSTVEQGYIFGRLHSSALGDLPDLLAYTTPISRIPFLIRDDTPVDDEHLDYSQYQTARFTWKSYGYTKSSQLWKQDSNLTDEDHTAIHLYPLAYEQITQIILEAVDDILAESPNAVIILQSDHGFHINETQQYLLDKGYPLAQVLELVHSVFSAVLIPPEYGRLDEPIAPLNISRVLVNRFVGENYALLE